ncbi:MAG: ATPase [Ruminococcus sp.]|nr:ATPase [Ruminococcus sp.]
MSETYFLGAVSGGSFRTEFGSIIADSSYFTYILKGGAGTGKSSMMKRIAEHFENRFHIVRYCCSSDPGSLDAVVIPELKTAVCDGTAPHVFEPVYPGICQQYIDLGQYWDSARLSENRAGIIDAADRNRSLLSRAKRFTSAAADICSDTFQIGADCLLAEKLEGFVGRTAKKLLGRKSGGEGSRRLLRLTALTEYGIMTHHETLESCFDVFTLRDELYAATDYLLSRLADEACLRGFDVILSPDQMLSDAAYQHLVIPELGIAFISGTAAAESQHRGAQRLNLMRFYDKSLLTARRIRIRMNRQAAADLTTEAAAAIREAKAVHDELETYYIAAMDHPALDKLTDKIISDTESKIPK